MSTFDQDYPVPILYSLLTNDLSSNSTKFIYFVVELEISNYQIWSFLNWSQVEHWMIDYTLSLNLCRITFCPSIHKNESVRPSCTRHIARPYASLSTSNSNLFTRSRTAQTPFFDSWRYILWSCLRYLWLWNINIGKRRVWLILVILFMSSLHCIVLCLISTQIYCGHSNATRTSTNYMGNRKLGWVCANTIK
jgi:hypothetical protein